MKKQIFALALGVVLAVGAFASTSEEATQLWNQRGDAKDNSLKAANIVRDLADTEQNVTLKADLKSREAEYIYFFGGRETSKDAKKKAYERGQNAAQASVNLLSSLPRTAETTVALARANYFYAINLGKWGEANGVLASLFRLGELLDRLETVEGLDRTVEDYGANRVRARAYHKVPGKSKEEAERLLAEASENTLADTVDISRNSTTVFYYLDILAKNGNGAKFCEVYRIFKKLSTASDADLLAYNENRLAETKADLQNFVKNEDFESDVQGFAKKQNCLR